MLDYAREAEAMVGGRRRGDLDTDRMLELAVIQLICMVGRAANRVSAPQRMRSPEIPWAAMVATGDRLLREFDAVDLDRVWRIATDDLPDLIRSLERILPRQTT